jgi:hypothetical protein
MVSPLKDAKLLAEAAERGRLKACAERDALARRVDQLERNAAKFTKFRLGDRVRKTSGSEWQGRIVGTYSTELTPEGYAVESEAHKGSVQIYPAKALEEVE